ncbi:MAG: hypothetical protein FRX48_02757 [Lasallia pustulata]|uniref:Dienelactone hydrolase n=1 Tax=Lasallia pustulata TaxID=136370 RepID=A0A5M8PVF9_9LECA|nr:MAG: hypothetical protein FRX48_02757 [Lasallia pustulata]
MKFNWTTGPLRLVLTAESADFDSVTIQNWKDEGYSVSYLPFVDSRKEYIHKLQHLADPLELGQKYAIVAYGEAATVALGVCRSPMAKLCALVAYYPTELPVVTTGFPPSLTVAVHLTESQPKAPKTYGSTYRYPHAEEGFAENDLETYEKVAASLAWSRSLAAVRKGFDVEVDLEKVWEEHLALEFLHKDADSTMRTMVPEPYVNHIPTITGGIGSKDLHRFYRDFFIPNNPPSMRFRLISRTIGTDRVVDEMFLSFRHTQEISWILPGVKPTDREVEVALVSIVCIRGGKLYHEHIYWDQATVLVQIGLLDAKMVPKGKFAKKLPVVGREGARKVLDESSVPSNELIEKW